MKQLDKTNKKILRILQRNGAITNAELSQQIGLSPATTLERVKKLERNEIIIKYATLIDGEKVNKDVMVFLEVSVTAHGTASVQTFIEAVREIPEVLECHQISGNQDFLIKIITSSIKSYKILLSEKIATLPNIGKIESKFVLSTGKNTTEIPIE